MALLSFLEGYYHIGLANYTTLYVIVNPNSVPVTLELLNSGTPYALGWALL